MTTLVVMRPLAMLAVVAAASVLYSCGSRDDGRPPGGMSPETYGSLLVMQTSERIGPDQPNRALRYTGNHLECGSCHAQGGTKPGSLSLLDTFAKYPRMSGRDGGVRDLKARINGCMLRSMNGRVLPEAGVEMAAIAAYIQSLGGANATAGARAAAEPDLRDFTTPDRAADPGAGKRVFDSRCVICHGPGGLGRHPLDGPLGRYVFPPLWGPDSFNDGAGMHRVLTAAKFIKATMPLGHANLTDDESFDVAAYINVQPRPAMANLDRDYPDRATKPVDNPYGPYADGFPIEQHRLGPFKPIEAFYARLKVSK